MKTTFDMEGLSPSTLPFDMSKIDSKDIEDATKLMADLLGGLEIPKIFDSAGGGVAPPKFSAEEKRARFASMYGAPTVGLTSPPVGTLVDSGGFSGTPGYSGVSEYPDSLFQGPENILSILKEVLAIPNTKALLKFGRCEGENYLCLELIEEKHIPYRHRQASNYYLRVNSDKWETEEEYISK